MLRRISRGSVVTCALVMSSYACGNSSADHGASDAGAASGADSAVATDGASTGQPDAGTPLVDAASQAVTDTLGSNRDRLLATYLAYLKANATTTQSNGLSGSNVTDVCDLWQKLAPSARAVFLTLTARLQGSKVAVDGRSPLWHVSSVYRIAGGQNATATDPGSCGGGEYNRMIMSMDTLLHDAWVAANTNKGQVNAKGQIDIADIPTNANAFWRDSHDTAGPHAPFDLSDETDAGAPRGQVQYFKDPSSVRAKTALGRMDLMTLVDPLAIEMDQDYDCTHNSNPSCTYTLYGPFCAPEASMLASDLYAKNYGSFEPGYSACDASGDGGAK